MTRRLPLGAPGANRSSGGRDDVSSVTFSGPSTARRPLSQRRPQLRLPRLQLGRQQLGTVPPEVRVAAVALGVPLVGEAAARDVPEQLPHRGGQVVVVVAVGPAELPVLAGGGVVLHL